MSKINTINWVIKEMGSFTGKSEWLIKEYFKSPISFENKRIFIDSREMGGIVGFRSALKRYMVNNDISEFGINRDKIKLLYIDDIFDGLDKLIVDNLETIIKQIYPNIKSVIATTTYNRFD